MISEIETPANGFTPRGYQQQAHDAVISGDSQFQRQCIVMPTGSGKTPVAAMIMDTKLPGKTLMLAHREDLIDQAHRTVRDCIGIEAGIEMGLQHSTPDDFVVIGSVQSMVNRLDGYSTDHFHAIIVDEAHHILSSTYQRVLSHFPNAKVYGITATPDRGDRRNIAAWFDSMTYEISMLALIKAGFLCPIKVLALPVQINLKDVPANRRAGSLHEGLSHQTLLPLMRNIAQQLKYHVGDRKTMVFLPLVKTSEEFAEMCREIGLDAKHIDSGMNDHDKKAVKKWFKNTKTGVLCNAMICAEGFDEPSVSAICCLRFCTSRPLFAQICGRGMRVHESKKDCILLDFMYQHEIHPLVRPSDLFSDTPEVSQLMTEKSFQSGEPMNLMELEEESSTEAAEARRKSLAKDLLAKANRKARRVDPLLLAEGFNNLKVQDYEPIFAWEKEPMTASQKAELENYDINTSMVKTKGYAHVILEWLKELYKQNRPTPKQYAQLIQHKHPYPNSVTSQQAGAWLGEKYKQFEEWSKRRRRS